MAVPNPQHELERVRQLAKKGLPAVVVVCGAGTYFRGEAITALLAAVPADAELRTVDGQQVLLRGLAAADGDSGGDDPGGEEPVIAGTLETPASCPELEVLRGGGLFARRGFNIDTLTVGPTDDEQISRVTLTVDGALHPIDQVTKQLHKLINVLKIRDLEPKDTVARELALFKVSADGVQRGELMQIAEIFRGKVVDVTKRAVIVEITGTTDKIAAFEDMVRPFGLIEMMRTGEIAIGRGRHET